MDKKIVSEKLVPSIGKTEIGREQILSSDKPIPNPYPEPVIPQRDPDEWCFTKTPFRKSRKSLEPVKRKIVEITPPRKFGPKQDPLPEPLTFVARPEFDVPSGDCGTKIENINVYSGASGGVPPYEFRGDKTVVTVPPWPDWLNIDLLTGEISGTRPNVPSSAMPGIIRVTDTADGKAYDNINIGSVTLPTSIGSIKRTK